jgi:hypothetical protein
LFEKIHLKFIKLNDEVTQWGTRENLQKENMFKDNFKCMKMSRKRLASEANASLRFSPPEMPFIFSPIPIIVFSDLTNPN